jgi:hypothetical protein
MLACACRPLPACLQLQELRLENCAVSDPGLLSALPRCSTLRQLALYSCWLVSEAGLNAAAAAAVQAGGQLEQMALDGVPLALSLASAGSRRAIAGGPGSTPGPAAASPGVLTPGSGRRSSGAGRLMAKVLAHDERLAYTTDEMLHLRAAVAAAAAPAAASQPVPSSAEDTGAASSQVVDWQQSIQQLRQSLPPDLRT